MLTYSRSPVILRTTLCTYRRKAMNFVAHLIGAAFGKGRHAGNYRTPRTHGLQPYGAGAENGESGQRAGRNGRHRGGGAGEIGLRRHLAAWDSTRPPSPHP